MNIITMDAFNTVSYGFASPGLKMNIISMHVINKVDERSSSKNCSNPRIIFILLHAGGNWYDLNEKLKMNE